MRENIKKRVIIIANKWWECNPILSVLLNNVAHPFFEPSEPQLRYNLDQNKKSIFLPRVVLSLTNINAELWCVSDLLNHYPKNPHFQSSSERKMEQMDSIFKYSNQLPALVIAVGTAASYPESISVNGSVIIGTKVFMHNCYPNGSNPYSNWNFEEFDEVISSPIKKNDFQEITTIETDPQTITNQFLVPPLNPDPSGGKLIAGYDYVALNTINVTDYSEYSTMDLKTIEAYKKRYDLEYCKSIETTHGLIRVAAGMRTEYLFISGIVNRFGHFKEDVESKPYPQNNSCAHNAGVVIAWMLPKINNLLCKY